MSELAQVSGSGANTLRLIAARVRRPRPQEVELVRPAGEAVQDGDVDGINGGASAADDAARIASPSNFAETSWPPS
jgi:hypothetical protein